MASNPLAQEQVWFDKYRAEDAERAFHEQQSGCSVGCSSVSASTQQEAAPAASGASAVDGSVLAKIQSLEKENQELRTITQSLAAVCRTLEDRIVALEKAGTTNNHKAAPAPAPQAAPAPAKTEEADEDDDDDDFDLFDDDEEEDDASKEEAEKLRQERVDAYTAKKTKKPTLIAKSSLLLDVKPWDDETDMAELEKCVRTIEMDGLLWGASKFVAVGYGIRKLVINCVVEDDKVSTDDLEDQITGFEDYVQSMDIAAFNKI